MIKFSKSKEKQNNSEKLEKKKITQEEKIAHRIGCQNLVLESPSEVHGKIILSLK